MKIFYVFQCSGLAAVAAMMHALERFALREPVYRRWADHIITEFSSPEATADAILEVMK